MKETEIDALITKIQLDMCYNKSVGVNDVKMLMDIIEYLRDRLARADSIYN